MEAKNSKEATSAGVLKDEDTPFPSTEASGDMFFKQAKLEGE